MWDQVKVNVVILSVSRVHSWTRISVDFVIKKASQKKVAYVAMLTNGCVPDCDLVTAFYKVNITDLCKFICAGKWWTKCLKSRLTVKSWRLDREIRTLDSFIQLLKDHTGFSLLNAKRQALKSWCGGHVKVDWRDRILEVERFQRKVFSEQTVDLLIDHLWQCRLPLMPFLSPIKLLSKWTRAHTHMCCTNSF